MTANEFINFLDTHGKGGNMSTTPREVALDYYDKLHKDGHIIAIKQGNETIAACAYIIVESAAQIAPHERKWTLPDKRHSGNIFYVDAAAMDKKYRDQGTISLLLNKIKEIEPKSTILLWNNRRFKWRALDINNEMKLL